MAGRANDETFNGLAWVLATSHHRELRDGPRAVTFAEKAVAGTNRKDPMQMDTLAAAYAEVGQFTNAVRVQREAIALLQDQKWREAFASRLKLYEVNVPYRPEGWLAYAARTLLSAGKYVEAEPFARECLAIRQVLMPDEWRTFNARSLLGGSLLGQKKYAEAEPLLLAGYAGMKARQDMIPAGNPNPKQALERLVLLYEQTDRPAQLAEWKQQLIAFNEAAAAKDVVTPKP